MLKNASEKVFFGKFAMLNGRYHLETRVGVGGSGQVWKAWDEKNQSYFAIKILTDHEEKQKKRFWQEYEILSTTKHPNLVKAYQCFEEQGRLFMVLEFLPGQNLEQILQSKSSFSLLSKIALSHCIIQAIAALNNAGVLHRDIKPQNIMIHQEEEKVSLFDLGIGKKLGQQSNRLTLDDEMLGTFSYISPEQADGRFSKQSDIFSAGVTLYQLFTEDPVSPFHDSNPLALIYRIGNYTPPTLLEVIQEKEQEEDLSALDQKTYEKLDALLEKAMEKKPHNRWEKASLMAEKLFELQEEYLAQKGINPAVSNPFLPASEKAFAFFSSQENSLKEEISSKPKRTNRLGWFVFIALIFLVFIISTTFFLQEQSQEHFQKSCQLYRENYPQQAWDEVEEASRWWSDSRYRAQKGRLLYFKGTTPSQKKQGRTILRQELAKLQKLSDPFSSSLLGDLYLDGMGEKPQLKKAFYFYQKAARTGDIHSMVELGVFYEQGKGTKKNIGKAINWWYKASKVKNEKALFCLGKLYEEGKFVSSDQRQAEVFFTEAAQKGSPEASQHLGKMYLTGKISNLKRKDLLLFLKRPELLQSADILYLLGDIYAKNKEKKDEQIQALNYYLSAAKKGNSSAMKKLALLYYQGQGVVKNHRESLRWYKESALSGDTEAMFSLASLYFQENNPSFPQNLSQAIYWFEKAAEQGHAKASFNLAGLHYEGKGLPQNQEKAFYWHKKAAEQDPKNIPTLMELGLAHFYGEGTPQNFARAQDYFTRCALIDHPPAMHYLAGMYYQGQTSEPNFSKAAYWFEKAAQANHTPSMCDLGNMYLLGQGVQKNPKKGIIWLRKAAGQGNTDAMYALADVFYSGKGVRMDYVKAMHWFHKAKKLAPEKEEKKLDMWEDLQKTRGEK